MPVQTGVMTTISRRPIRADPRQLSWQWQHVVPKIMLLANSALFQYADHICSRNRYGHQRRQMRIFHPTTLQCAPVCFRRAQRESIKCRPVSCTIPLQSELYGHVILMAFWRRPFVGAQFEFML